MVEVRPIEGLQRMDSSTVAAKFDLEGEVVHGWVGKCYFGEEYYIEGLGYHEHL